MVLIPYIEQFAVRRPPTAAVQRLLGTVIIGGLFAFTALARIVLPALYHRFAHPTQAPVSSEWI